MNAFTLSSLMQWSDKPLTLFLLIQRSHLEGMSESFALSIEQHVGNGSEQTFKENLGSIVEDRKAIRENIFDLLTQHSVSVFVSVSQEHGEPSTVLVKVDELKSFLSGVSEELNVRWWPSHFKTYEECEKWVNENLKLVR